MNSVDARHDRTGTITAQRREAIRRAAAIQFAEHGYHGASLRQIAAASGLAQGHLYYYYPSKQELLCEIITVLQDRFNAAMDAAVARSGDPVDALRGLLVEHVRILCEHVTDATVSYESLRFLTPEHRADLIDKRDAYEAGLRRLIQDSRAELPIAALSNELLGKIALGIVNWPYQWYRSNGPLPPEEIAKHLADQAIAALFTITLSVQSRVNATSCTEP